MVTISKVIARNWLGDVPDDKRFYCVDGRTMKNFSELETALNEMTDDSFRYHSNESKSDFHNWVKDVIGDDKLAKDLKASASRALAAKKVGARITFLKSKIAKS